MQSMTEVDRVDSVQENPARESYLRPDDIEMCTSHTLLM